MLNHKRPYSGSLLESMPATDTDQEADPVLPLLELGKLSLPQPEGQDAAGFQPQLAPTLGARTQ